MLSPLCLAKADVIRVLTRLEAVQRALSSLAAASGGGISAAASSAAASPAGGPPSSVPVDRLQQAITPQVCEHLQQHGYAVVDNVFGEQAAAALRAEVAAVRGRMHKNCTHLVQGCSTALLEKQHIWEAELMLPETQVRLNGVCCRPGPRCRHRCYALWPSVRLWPDPPDWPCSPLPPPPCSSGLQALAPLCAQLQHDSTLRVMLSLLMPRLSLQTQAIKLQWNEGGQGWLCRRCLLDVRRRPAVANSGRQRPSLCPHCVPALPAALFLTAPACWCPHVPAGQGGCFPIHTDTDAAVDSRRVTAIWYLNPGWRQGDGGELRLYPFPQVGAAWGQGQSVVVAAQFI